jgi:hypothetical protein
LGETRCRAKVFLQGSRDIIKIEDFQIGIDTIILPKLPTVLVNGVETSNPNYYYQIDAGSQGSEDGVFISIYQNANPSNEPLKKIAFITNNYTTQGLDPAAFEGNVRNLLVNNQIGNLSKAPVIGSNNTNGFIEIIDLEKASFANDRIYANDGKDLVYGYYGDDTIFWRHGRRYCLRRF